MRKSFRFVLSLLAALAYATLGNTGQARAQAYGTELPFVLGTDARVSAMGLAGVSLSGNASIQYYNPAGMSYLHWKQFAFFRTVLFESDVIYQTFSYSHPLLNYGTIGISVLRLDAGGVEERDDNNQLISSDLSNSQTRILLGYSKHVTSSIATGFNIKIDNQSFGSSSGSGIGLDIGIAATQHANDGHSFVRGFREGFSIQNLIEPTVKLDQDEVGDPMQMALGVTMLSGVGNAFMETVVDLVMPRFSPVKLQIGQEIKYEDVFSFRFGLDGTSPSYGMGATYKSATLDYAYRNTDIGGNHQFSMSFRFGSSVSQLRTESRARLEQQVNNAINLRMEELEQEQIAIAQQRGDSLYEFGDYKRAAVQFESALLWDPGNEHAQEYLTKTRFKDLMNEARSTSERGDFVQGLFNAKQALELVPGDSQAQAIVDLCNEEITASQNSAKLVNNLLKASIDYYATSEFAKALAGFDELIRIAPSNELAGEYRSKCLLQIEEQWAAKRRLVQEHLSSSQIAADRGDYRSAIYDLQMALILAPGNKRISRRIAELEEKASEEQAVDKKPSPSAPVRSLWTGDREELEQNFERGMRFFNEGEFDKAIGLLMRVWITDPSFRDVDRVLTKSYLLTGMRLYSKDDYESAMAAWKRALTIDPSNAKAKLYLARTEEEYKRSKERNE